MTNINHTSVVAFAFGVRAVLIDDFWYASSPVRSPGIACVGETAAAAITFWVQLLEQGEL